jgi:hypothetical protein
MRLRYGAFCFLLFFAILVLVIKNYETWTRPIEFFPEKGVAKKSETKTKMTPAVGGQKEPESTKSYISIAEKNIFNPERKDFPILVSMAESSKKPFVRPQIVLYGVIAIGDYQSASISNPGRPLQKGERDVMTLKIGDRIGEYQLTKILSDRIIMETPEDTFEVLLSDPKMPKKRSYVKTENKPAPITSALPGPAPTPPEAPKPTPSKEQVQRVGEPARERVTTPSPPPSPTTPPSLSPTTRRGMSPIYSPPGAPSPGPPATGAPPVGPPTGYPSPDTSTQETGGI